TLDAFADAMIRIKGEDAAFLRDAPHTMPRSRPDEVKAAKEPILRWKEGQAKQQESGGTLKQPTA
ncbi:MAG: hypothetical protein K2W96_20610, partial [Gemmataceae bacterium]|nr:hypothetical protein [Gemmataceae bacterium]